MKKRKWKTESKLKKTMRIFYVRYGFLSALFLFFLNNCHCNKNSETQNLFTKKNEDSFALLFTTNVRGYIEPCGCTSDPLGGLDRLAFVVKEAQKAFSGRLLFIDAGNLFFDSKGKKAEVDLCQDEAKIDILLSTYQNLKVIGTLPGPFDLGRGEHFYRSFLQKYHISILNETLLRGQIFEQSGVKIAIIGIGKELEDTNFPNAVFDQEVQRLKKAGASIVVAVVQAQVSFVRKWFHDKKDIDVVIVGQEMNEMPLPPELLSKQGPWLVSAGMQGQYLGVVELKNISQKKTGAFQLDDRKEKKERRVRLLQNRAQSLKKQIKDATSSRRAFLEGQLQSIKAQLEKTQSENESVSFQGPHLLVRMIAIRKNMKPLPEVREKLVAYEKIIPKLAAKCEAKIDCQAAKPGEPTYVGAKACQKCHQDAFDVWQNAVVELAGKDEKGQPIKRSMGHSMAWATLEKKHKEMDRNCIGCHSVGFMEPGGYCKVGEVDFRRNVQCESCHGPGSLHAATGHKKWIKREVPESTCRSCHHVPHIESTQSFVYEDKLKLILGKGHGEALLMRLQHGGAKSDKD